MTLLVLSLRLALAVLYGGGLLVMLGELLRMRPRRRRRRRHLWLVKGKEGHGG